MDKLPAEQNRGYVDPKYLQELAHILRHDKQRTYELMNVQPGHHVLDLGCGAGTDTIALAHLVGPKGRVAGVDYDPNMIVEADRAAVIAGVAERINHHHADGSVVPFPDNSFDACRSERVFQHLEDPLVTLAEMIRVTKRGGRIVVLDTDWGSSSTDTTETELERQWVMYSAAQFYRNGFSGRTLYRLFRQQSLTDITVELRPIFITNYALARFAALWDDREQMAVATGTFTRDEMNRLQRSFERAAANDTFFTSIMLILVAGRKG